MVRTCACDELSLAHTRRTLPQAAQKDRPARPQRVKAQGVPSGYVEGLNDARTPLADFFSSLREKNGLRQELRDR